MKRILLFSLFIPFVGGSGFTRVINSTEIPLADVRTGKWPISLEKWVGHRDTSFVLLFRDQGVMMEEVMDTLPFKDLHQLRYLDSAFSVLNNDGDIANFDRFSIKRTTKRVDGTSYLLRYQEGATEFRQQEVTVLRSTIRKL